MDTVAIRPNKLMRIARVILADKDDRPEFRGRISRESGAGNSVGSIYVFIAFSAVEIKFPLQILLLIMNHDQEHAQEIRFTRRPNAGTTSASNQGRALNHRMFRGLGWRFVIITANVPSLNLRQSLHLKTRVLPEFGAFGLLGFVLIRAHHPPNHH